LNLDGSSYGGGQAGYGGFFTHLFINVYDTTFLGYGSSYGGQTGYGGQNYGGFFTHLFIDVYNTAFLGYGSSYGGQTGYGGLGSMFG
jgi:TorA maturation chaperone TorD